MILKKISTKICARLLKTLINYKICKFIRRIRIRQEKVENRIGKWLILKFKINIFDKIGLKVFLRIFQLINIRMNYLYINSESLRNKVSKKHNNIFLV